jgi:hypothetical protein
MAHTEFAPLSLPLILIPSGPLPDHESPFLLLSIDTNRHSMFSHSKR